MLRRVSSLAVLVAVCRCRFLSCKMYGHCWTACGMCYTAVQNTANDSNTYHIPLPASMRYNLVSHVSYTTVPRNSEASVKRLTDWHCLNALQDLCWRPRIFALSSQYNDRSTPNFIFVLSSFYRRQTQLSYRPRNPLRQLKSVFHVLVVAFVR